MILDEEIWMDIRRFKALRESGTTYADIARECGVDYRTVKKYLAADAPGLPPVGSPRAGTQPRVITPVFEAVIRKMLTQDVELKASVVHERLVSEHGFTGTYQRVKMACRDLRPLVEVELDDADEVRRWRGLHRRFATLPGAQAQVDWGLSVSAITATKQSLRSTNNRIALLTHECRDLEAAIPPLVRSMAPALLDEPGVGVLLAARILVSWSHLGRCRDEAEFTRLGGVAP